MWRIIIRNTCNISELNESCIAPRKLCTFSWMCMYCITSTYQEVCKSSTMQRILSPYRGQKKNKTRVNVTHWVRSTCNMQFLWGEVLKVHVSWGCDEASSRWEETWSWWTAASKKKGCVTKFVCKMGGASHNITCMPQRPGGIKVISLLHNVVALCNYVLDIFDFYPPQLGQLLLAPSC